ncbi:MAG: aldehyde dehydrogenase [Ignavibacteria bacterium GWF2_33_9]|nr:MAG: aldehyde dehydrogenase [Ignavibacteria bacterium GWF2_33_9]
MNKEQILSLQLKQKEFFNTGKTKDIAFRIENLKKLSFIFQENEAKILLALKTDLNKSHIEAYSSEIGYILQEIKIAIKNLKKWNRKKKVKTSLINFPGKSYYVNEPYGTVLVISPWNYPFGLLFTPLVGAIAAGNCIIAKPSEISTNSSKLIYELISKNFPEEFFSVIEGGAEITQSIINENIDYIFFTGSTVVGKEIFKSASEHLIPVTLELGGKNPCIVDKNIDIEIAAKRLLWGKFFNAGQTCVAPDYLLLNKNIQEEFLTKLVDFTNKFYGNFDEIQENFTRIISQKHFDRIIGYLNEGKIIFGGKYVKNKLLIEPTIITDLNYHSKIMQEEVFGPVLPIISYEDINVVIEKLNKLSKPLCVYLFTKDKELQSKIVENTVSGTVCINGTIHSIISHDLPFGGVGESGMGRYHGKTSFETFSFKKSILKKKFWWDWAVMYPPYKTSLNLFKKVAKYFY